MKRITWTCSLVLVATIGCQRGPQSVVEGEAGQKLGVSAPETVTISQGNTTKFSVTVTRKKINDPAKVTIEGLPKGVAVTEGDLKFDEGINDQFVTIEAVADAAPQKDAAVSVTATAGKFTAVKQFKINVVESLENKKVHKKAFADEIEGRLSKVKSMLDSAEKHVNASKDDGNRAVYLKQISERFESLDDARKYHEKLLGTPVEVWEREKDEVIGAVTTAEKTTQALLIQLKTLKN